MNVTVFDLQKVMVRAYQDPGVTAVFVEMLYDYLNSTSGVNKISYIDGSKYIDITTSKVDSLKFTANIKELYARFVINVINTNNLEYILSKEPSYAQIKALKEPDLFNIAVGAITVLDLSNNVNESTFRINLIN